MSWNAGYVTDVNYTFGYYADFNPVRTNYALAMAGVSAPPLRNACELGFGQGLSVAIHAAAQPGVQWWGTDFNPAQAGFAQELAAHSGSGARLFDQAFEEFCARDDLPEFEFIALHGIWTWVSDENRAIIVDFVRRKLAVGGTLYISYNTLPGWSAAAPLRHLMKQHGDLKGSPSVKVTQRIDDAFGFMDELMAAQPIYMRGNPTLAERYSKLKDMDRRYLAHEYMNRDWRPMYFSEIAEWLEPAKVSYAAAANLLEQQDAINMTPDQINMVGAQEDRVFRETVRDFITAQQFRRDLWMRGVRQLSSLEQAEALRKMRFLLTTRRADVKLALNGMQGEVTLHESVYGPLLDFLANHDIKSFGQIEVAGQAAGISLSQVAAAMAILTGAGTVAVVQDDKTIAKARPIVEKLNGLLVQKSRSRSEIGYLASPVTGGGFLVDRMEQLLLAVRGQGRKTAAEWAQGVYDILAGQGQQIIKDGRALTTPEENLAELATRAATLEQRLPILRALGIA
jgi:hypothetical protein